MNWIVVGENLRTAGVLVKVVGEVVEILGERIEPALSLLRRTSGVSRLLSPDPAAQRASENPQKSSEFLTSGSPLSLGDPARLTGHDC